MNTSPIVKPAMQHNYSGQDVPVYIVDIGSRRVVVAQAHVKKPQQDRNETS